MVERLVEVVGARPIPSPLDFSTIMGKQEVASVATPKLPPSMVPSTVDTQMVAAGRPSKQMYTILPPIEDLTTNPPWRMGDVPNMFRLQSKTMLFDTQSMHTIFDTVMRRYDRGEKGYLSQEDVLAGLSIRGLSKNDVGVLKLLRNSGDRIASLSNDELGFENDGVFQADINRYIGLFENYNHWQRILNFIDDHKTELQSDNYDNMITKENVEEMLDTGRIGEQRLDNDGRSDLAYLDKYWDDIAESTKQSVVPEDTYRHIPISEADLEYYIPGRSIDNSPSTNGTAYTYSGFPLTPSEQP